MARVRLVAMVYGAIVLLACGQGGSDDDSLMEGLLEPREHAAVPLQVKVQAQAVQQQHSAGPAAVVGSKQVTTTASLPPPIFILGFMRW